ncbi:MAG: TatD family hydrolase [Candidatus Thiodiazotropha endolucinida]|nr:TatD family hydrolase [Candidatus Thiodiazotropha taylori]MCW4346293.1 TatD family hydrolase [Candidatus Thiodiazotropha endolucinida]
MTIEYPSTSTQVGKRAAESRMSSSTSKKQRLDDILPSGKEAGVGEETSSKINRFRLHTCWVPGCDEPANRYAKAHAFKKHIPGIFTETLPSSDLQVLRGRKLALMQAARWLLNRPTTLDELLRFVNVQHMLVSADNSCISPIQKTAMVDMCKYLQCPVPSDFTLVPASTPGVLIHWKAILLIAASLDDDERSYWRDSFPEPDTTGEVERQEPVRALPLAFDSHFHLDRSLQHCGLPRHGSLDDVLADVHVNEGERVQLVGTVAVFCDPVSYPSGQSLLDLPKDMHVAAGIHPRHAHRGHRFVEESIQDLSVLLQNPRVKALGEVGLDHTEQMKNWHLQVDLLNRVLPLLQDHHVLVIHCRGMKNDCGTEVYLLLLHVLQQHVRPNQPIHLHCFAGNPYVLQRWLAVYPRTYFGFTNMVKSFRPDQIEALKSIEETRLLLESDAPYFPSMGTQRSSPGQLFTVAKAVAEYRRISTDHLLDITVRNAEYLYQEQ